MSQDLLDSDTAIPTPPDHRRMYGFLLLDDYPLLPVSGMIDVLRDADYVTNRINHSWCTIGATQHVVKAMNGFRSLTDYTLDDAPPCDVIVVCAGLGGHRIENQQVFRWLRARFAKKAIIGAIATGTWVLAKAGLLAGRRCTIHWEEIPALVESYPLLEVDRTLYVRDGPVFTCSGGTAAIDLFLQFMTESLGPNVSSEVARQILHQSGRVGSDVVPIKEGPYYQINDTVVRQAAALMHDNLENSISIKEIADKVGVSQKKLERVFKSHFHTTPQLHYRDLRLEEARALVRLTKLEIWQISIITGFSSPQYMTKCYRNRFDISPSEERRALRNYLIPSG